MNRDAGPIVTAHAVARFRERFPGLCRNGPADDSVAAAIRACLAGPVRESPSDNGFVTIRTRHPFALRIVVREREGRREVVTVLRGDKSKGDVAAQKARRAARKAAQT